METAVVVIGSLGSEGVAEGRRAGVQCAAIEGGSPFGRQETVEEQWHFIVGLGAAWVTYHNTTKQAAPRLLLEIHEVIVEGPGSDDVLSDIEDVAPGLTWADGIAAPTMVPL